VSRLEACAFTLAPASRSALAISTWFASTARRSAVRPCPSRASAGAPAAIRRRISADRPTQPPAAAGNRRPVSGVGHRRKGPGKSEGDDENPHVRHQGRGTPASVPSGPKTMRVIRAAAAALSQARQGREVEYRIARERSARPSRSWASRSATRSAWASGSPFRHDLTWPEADDRVIEDDHRAVGLVAARYRLPLHAEGFGDETRFVAGAGRGRSADANSPPAKARKARRWHPRMRANVAPIVRP
jgi:hypothetical protein